MLETIRETIGFYSLTAIVGIIFAIIVLLALRKRMVMPYGRLFQMLAFAVVGVVLGSHLLFFIVNLPDWIEYYVPRIHSVQDFLDAFANGASGLVFYGGLIGALLMLFFYCRMYKLPLRPNFNYAVIVFPLFHAFGRIGCTLTGCCYGIEYHGPLAIHYDSSYIVAGVSDDIADFSRFPVQLLEAGLEIIIFIVLLILYIKTINKYSLTCIYLISYGVIRFFDEFLRGDAVRGIWGPFSTSQWISLVLVTAAIIYLILQRRKDEPSSENPGPNLGSTLS